MTVESLRMKEAAIRNEFQRIAQRCSNEGKAKVHEEKFTTILRHNGYDQKTVRRIKLSKTKQTTDKPREDPVYFKIPYISDGVNKKVERAFKSENLNVRIYHKPQTIRNALKRPSIPEECQLKNCPLKDPKLCHRKMVKYKIKCKKNATPTTSGARYENYILGSRNIWNKKHHPSTNTWKYARTKKSKYVF